MCRVAKHQSLRTVLHGVAFHSSTAASTVLRVVTGLESSRDVLCSANHTSSVRPTDESGFDSCQKKVSGLTALCQM